ncbi:MAG: hypothetical protein FWG10_08785 [Eubacteriaceae bacterium]|nr:hypothetical protein [Eubacteriaceae bacterium]
MLKKHSCKRFTGALLAICLLASCAPAASNSTKNGMWLKGDFHTHTYLSDGFYMASEVAAHAKQYGLDWYGACDHGGGSKGTLDENGMPWPSGAQTGGSTALGRSEGADRGKTVSTVMPRWGTIAGIGEDMINANRNDAALEGLLQFSGFEWNVPTHEHASVGIVGDSTDVAKALSQFDYLFDGATEAFNFDAFETEATEKAVAINGIEQMIKYAQGRQLDGKFEAYLDPADNKWKTTFAKEADQDASGNVIIGNDGKEVMAEVFGEGTLEQKKENAANVKANLTTTLSTNRHNGALDGAKWLQDNHRQTSYFLLNHPSRALAYRTSDFREFNDIAPDVCFGAELLPGHQASAFRGGLGYMNFYDTYQKKVVTINTKDSEGNSYNSLDEAVDAYIANLPEATDQTKVETDKKAILNGVAKARTYGGADYMLAQVGGLWDALLSEGRRFWAFGNSDFHVDSERSKSFEGSEPDFWPGQYSKNYTYTYSKDYQGILDGMRSGNSFVVLGDLIDSLDFHISDGSVTATMGENLSPAAGKESKVTIKFSSPSQNNNGNTPEVDHIDLIAGEVGAKPSKYADAQAANDPRANPTDYLTAAYQTESVSTTKVIKTFEKGEFKKENDGSYSVTFTLPETDKPMYYRLRGTNNAKGTANCDAEGNPTIDNPIESLKGVNTEDKAFSDLWFYSNPIFVGAAE